MNSVAVVKSDLIKNVLYWAQLKQSKDLKKTDGKKAVKLTGIPKLDDANDAGARSSCCSVHQ